MTLHTPIPPSADVAGYSCPVCREPIVPPRIGESVTSQGAAGAGAALSHCPHCEEPLAPVKGSSLPAHGLRRGTTALLVQNPLDWLGMHWRPVVALGTIGLLLLIGMVLRIAAPERLARQPGRALRPIATCAEACWQGESCVQGQCQWIAPKEATHLPARVELQGGYNLPFDVSDILPINRDTLLTAAVEGPQLRNAATGEVLSVINDAPLGVGLERIDDNIYTVTSTGLVAIALDQQRAIKSIFLGHRATSLLAVPGSDRMLAAVPDGRFVAILSTSLHTEIERYSTGEDLPVAMATSGNGPALIAGQRSAAQKSGTLHAFDATRFLREQAEVRMSLREPIHSIAPLPSGNAAWVSLPESHRLLKLSWKRHGELRSERKVEVCTQPTELLFIARSRQLAVLCEGSRELQLLDAVTGAQQSRWQWEWAPRGLWLSPDGEQIVVLLGGGPGKGAIVILSSASSESGVRIALDAEPTRLRATPDGMTAAVWAAASRRIWLLRAAP